MLDLRTGRSRARGLGLLALVFLIAGSILIILQATAWPAATSYPALAYQQAGPPGPGSSPAEESMPPLPPGFSGRVLDLATGAPIPGALVATGSAHTATDAQGRYFLAASPGAHDVRVKAPGYIGMTLLSRRVPGDGVSLLDIRLMPANPDPRAAKVIDRLVAGGEGQTARLAPAGGQVTGVGGGLPSTVRVLMPDGTVVRMDLDEYLRGVVPAEMPAYWPFEALKAQAVAARSYAVTRHLRPDADVDTTSRTQVWRPVHYDTSDAAVMATHGVVPRYQGGPIQALFFAHSDGHTRDSETVWGNYVPYLRRVADPNPFTTMFGHGVGLSQHGARTFALWGATYDEVLEHFYSGVSVPDPGWPVLSDPGVSPPGGDTATLFTFSVTYTDGDPPRVADVYVDGRAYAMTRASGDPLTGARYVFTTTLPAGDHTYSFHFSDGYLPAVHTEPQAGPYVEPGPPPAPEPPAQVTRAGAWRLASRLDFEAGDRRGLDLVGDPDAALVLQPGASSGEFTSPVLQADFPFTAIGSHWEAELPLGSELHLWLRASDDGVSWSDWTEVPPTDVQRWRADTDWGELVFLSGQYLQVRVRLETWSPDAQPRLDGLTLTYIQPHGPSLSQALAGARLTNDGVTIIPRSSWGVPDNSPGWPPEYHAPKVFIIHHTVTPNDADPIATIQAIYYYHAITRGWGDIGYNFLVDHLGNVYEGRYGGERDGEIVVGGHAQRYNYGSIGVALVGTFQEDDPPAPMEDSLVNFLAWEAGRYGIDPVGETYFIDGTFPNIMGHRDVLSTACPGDHAYLRLPEVRTRVLETMQAAAPQIQVISPPEGAVISGVVTITVQVTGTVVAVDFYADGVLLGTDDTPPFAWAWDTRAVADGPHTLRAVARTDSGWTGQATVAVFVDNSGSACRDIIINGDFESDAGWESLIPDRPLTYSAEHYRSPAHSLFLGLPTGAQDMQNWSSAVQLVTLPSNIVSATLSFWIWPESEDPSGDRQRLGWLDTDRVFQSILWDNADLNARTWVPVEVPLSGFAGQSFYLYFNAYNDGDGQGLTRMYLDDVSLVYCRSVEATPTPTAMITPTATVTATVTPSLTPTWTPTPVATATVTPTPTATPAPTGCVELLQNSGFEFDGAWAIGDTPRPARRTQGLSHSGQWSMLLGITDPAEDTFSFSSAWQDIYIPANVSSAVLSFWYFPLSGDPEDRQILEIRAPHDGLQDRLLGTDPPSDSRQWERLSFDLTEHHAGRDVRVYFTVFNRGTGGVTAMYLDDVSLLACWGTGERKHRIFLPMVTRAGL